MQILHWVQDGPAWKTKVSGIIGVAGELGAMRSEAKSRSFTPLKSASLKVIRVRVNNSLSFGAAKRLQVAG
jgi:hypothetical protein